MTTCFLLVFVLLFVPLLLEMLLFILVDDFICFLLSESNTKLDPTRLFVLLVIIILFLILLCVYNWLVFSVYFPREIFLFFCCK